MKLLAMVSEFVCTFLPMRDGTRRTKARNRFAVAAVCGGLVVALNVSAANAAVTAVPGAVGFGTTTPAGRGGTVHRVTSLADSGAGSLRACVAASGPRVCVFEISGYITLASVLSIRNPYITIAGQTAPSPGITVRGEVVVVNGDDVLIQHVRFRPGDIRPCDSNCTRDGFRVDVGADRVLLDHVSTSFSLDEVFSVWGPRTGIHIQDSLFGWPLDCNGHQKGCHGYGPTFGMPPDGSAGPEVSFVGNTIATAQARMPYVRGAAFMANNLVYNQFLGSQLSSVQGRPLRVSVVNNVFLYGPTSTSANSIRIEGSSLDKTSKVYVTGNSKAFHPASGNPADREFAVPGDQWGPSKSSGLVQIQPEVLNLWDGTYPTAIAAMKVESQSAAYWVPGFTARPVGSVYDQATRKSGARPADRDWVDRQIISDIVNAKGRSINCVTLQPSNVNCDTATEVAFSGASSDQYGWPAMAVNKRTLTLPTSPNSDANGDGYTNLEEWLHDMAAEVEGEDTTRPNPPEGLSIE